MSQEDIGVLGPDKVIRIVYFATGPMEGGIVRGFLFEFLVRTHSRGFVPLSLPKSKCRIRAHPRATGN